MDNIKYTFQKEGEHYLWDGSSFLSLLKKCPPVIGQALYIPTLNKNNIEVIRVPYSSVCIIKKRNLCNCYIVLDVRKKSKRQIKLLLTECKKRG